MMNIEHLASKMEFLMRDENGYIVSSAITDVDYYPPIYLDKIICKETNQRKDKKIVYLHCFGTEPHCRRKGYGRKLIQDVKQYYKGCLVYLRVSSIGEMTNEQLIDFYKSEGFNLVENTEKYVPQPVMYVEL